MSSEAITRNDLTAILNEVLPPTASEYRKLLWTNPSPTAAFGAQTLALDVDDYDAVCVEFNGETPPTIMSERAKTYYTMRPAYQANPTYRVSTLPATNGVYFDACQKNSGASTDNTLLIPYKIYGIKYERVVPPQLDASDYVVEQGVSGDWRYRIWESGLKEAWYGKNLGTLSLTKANYRNYLSYFLDEVCPLNLTTLITIQANAASSTTSLRFENVGYNTSTQKASGYFMGDSNSTASSGTLSCANVHLYLYVVGV